MTIFLRISLSCPGMQGLMREDGIRSVLEELGNYALGDEDGRRIRRIAERLEALDSEEIVRLVKERG